MEHFIFLQKKGSHIFYLNNVYSDPSIYEWFTEAFRATGRNLDMGKSCVRFRRLEDLPLEVIGEAIERSPVAVFVADYINARGDGGKSVR